VFVEKGAPPTRQEERPMELTDPVTRILDNYENNNPGTKANLARILLDMLGKIIKIYQGKD
jgi:hypothetical protein